jgi:hypothetical protein
MMLAERDSTVRRGPNSDRLCTTATRLGASSRNAMSPNFIEADATEFACFVTGSKIVGTVLLG